MIRVTDFPINQHKNDSSACNNNIFKNVGMCLIHSLQAYFMRTYAHLDLSELACV